MKTVVYHVKRANRRNPLYKLAISLLERGVNGDTWDVLQSLLKRSRCNDVALLVEKDADPNRQHFFLTGDSLKKLARYNLKPKATLVAFVDEPGEAAYVGWSLCCNRDVPCKKEGYRLAKARAEKAVNTKIIKDNVPETLVQNVGDFIGRLKAKYPGVTHVFVG
jgi:hypothetical protein